MDSFLDGLLKGRKAFVAFTDADSKRRLVIDSRFPPDKGVLHDVVNFPQLSKIHTSVSGEHFVLSSHGVSPSVWLEISVTGGLKQS
jgi:hypothetical protein